MTARPIAGVTAEVEAAFWQKVERRQTDECWPWTGPKISRDGRGQFFYKGFKCLAPRLSLAIVNGPPPSDDHHACHKCDNPNCVNPDHLWWGTNKENMLDASRKKRLGKNEDFCSCGTPFHYYYYRGWSCRTCRPCANAARRARNAARRAQALSLPKGEMGS